jgi:hypothetical protein
MIKKTENCIYCGEKMESVTAKKKFCSPLHRVYWNREQKAVKLLGDTFEATKEEFKKVANDIFEGGIAIAETTTEGVKRIDPISDKGEVVQRIAQIEKMLLMPQKYLAYNKRTMLEAELNQLKFKLQSNQ